MNKTRRLGLSTLGFRNRSRVDRWRWYHYYVVLALFDVAVIVAGVYALRNTLDSFDQAVADADRVHHQQRWFAELRSALMNLNTPGNEIFESGDVVAETAAFTVAKARLTELRECPPAGATLSTEFSLHVERLSEAAGDVFDSFRDLPEENGDSQRRRSQLARATGFMATMDRAQIDALATLAAGSQSSLLEHRAVLGRFRTALDGRLRAGIVFFVMVAVILAGIFWYARKLQRVHENLLIEQDRVESERRNRLAAVGEVCYACAHGIRNPLASVMSSAQLMQIGGALEEQDRSRVGDILATCDLLGQRVSRLLTFAHARSVPMVTLTPEEILDDAAGEFEGQLAERDVELLRRYEARGASFQGNGTWLVQAVGELLSNALAVVPDGGTITLVSAICASDPKQIELGVIDNGPGIPQNIRDQVCVLFFTQRANGHGIGLASVQRAADLHRGSVIIADAQSGGADVRLRIPRG